MTGGPFDCEVQPRFRDINVGGHVDSVEALRIIDEARIQLLLFADLHGDPEHPGLLRRKPAGIVDLMGSQRVDYRTEMRFASHAPFRCRLWICDVGRTSFTVASEMRVAADHPPALIAESTLVFWDKAAQQTWPMSEEVRLDLETLSGPRVGLRQV